MPELAEVEYYRKQWNPGLGRPVRAVLVHEHAKIFRGTDVGALQGALTGATLLSSQAAAKQMLFRFSNNKRACHVDSKRTSLAVDGWLGVHLGLTGALRAESPGYAPQRHDHLVLATD